MIGNLDNLDIYKEDKSLNSCRKNSQSQIALSVIDNSLPLEFHHKSHEDSTPLKLLNQSLGQRDKYVNLNNSSRIVSHKDVKVKKSNANIKLISNNKLEIQYKIEDKSCDLKKTNKTIRNIGDNGGKAKFNFDLYLYQLISNFLNAIEITYLMKYILINFEISLSKILKFRKVKNKSRTTKIFCLITLITESLKYI